MRTPIRLAVLFAALLLLPSSDGVRRARATSSPAPAIPGLSAPVTIVTDAAGIPHVRAATLDDLYAGWGYVSARDRMWQLALTRAQAQGLAHRWLGNSALQADGGAQLFRIAERAAAIWQRDRADDLLRRCIQRYTDGINARMDECRRGDAAWPDELTRLRVTPEPWRPEDGVLMLLAMGITLDLDLPELRESESIAKLGREIDGARRRYEGRLVYETIPHSLERYDTDEAASLSPQAAHGLPASTLALAKSASALYATRAADGSDRASNQMVVGRGRSASGAPLLANDPHLGLTTPGAFHVVHLSLPGVVEAIGAAVPGLPIVASGRNRDCAWGVTALSADVVDAYADTLSADGRRARGPRGWEKVIEKPFDLRYRVLGMQLPIPAFVQARRYTSHGPVVVFDKKKRLAITARWSAMEDGRISLARLVGLERSRSAAEIAERVRTLVTPGFNVVAADRAGHAVYQTAGLVPVRRFEFERGVLPSDGEHEWTGFIPAAEMPAWTLGPVDFAANGNNLPGGTGRHWPRFDWAHDRAARMAQRLAGDTRITRADLASVQNDAVSRSAQRTSPLLVSLAIAAGAERSARIRAALDTLAAWDFSMRRSRVAPTLNRSWWNAYLRRSGFEGYPGLAMAALTGEAAYELKDPAGKPESPPQAALAALEMALDTLTAKLGPDMSTWTWGRAHRARFAHALSAMSAEDRERFEPPYTPEDGDGSTPSVGGTRTPWSFDVRHGPCYRHVVDLADTVTSLGVLPPWNSELRRDSAMRNKWAKHDYVRFDMDWARVSASAVDVLTLQAPNRIRMPAVKERSAAGK